MSNITLLHYNNYFNRIVKKEDFYTSYLTSDPNYNKIQNVNFVPGDGITTSLILGTYSLHMGFDYAVVTEIVNGAETIASRWFLMEENRTRDGQYEIVLRRDVIVDNYNSIINSPIYLEKGTITDINNPLLYNSENYNVNQIKTSENLIKDKSGVAWIVGYVSSKLSTETKDRQITTIQLNSNGYASGSLVYTLSGAFVDLYVEYNGEKVYGNDGVSQFSYTFNPRTGIIYYTISKGEWASKTISMNALYTAIGTISGKTYKMTPPGDESRLHLVDAPYDMFCIPYGAIHLQSANIDTVKEAAIEIAFEFAKDLGKEGVYDIQLLPYCPRQNMLLAGKVVETLGTFDYDYNYIYDQSNNIKSIVIWCEKSTDSFLAEPESPIEVPRKLTSTATSGTLSGVNGRLYRTSTSSTNVSFRIENDIFKTRVVQSVTSLNASKGVNTDSITAFTSFTQSTDTGVLVVYYTGTTFPAGTQSNVLFTLGYTYKEFENPVYIDYKISNECDVYRLVSPNYNGQFEWSIAKSAGSSNLFDVDFTYKPFQPYIHVAPVFSKLYGRDFNDARGLICGGDFSMPIITDAWTEFQVQNKTYQDVFDRQIKHMDVENIIAGEQAAIGIVTGTISGALTGGVAGGKAGGAYGAIGGAIAGGATSLLGGIADYSNLLKMQEENRSFATDMFNYGLQNVKALPYGLTKVSAYTQNNKIFPMVEYYTCTDTEKTALKNKLTYNGMTVMVIGTLSDYIDANEKRFFKGQIIRLPDIKEDSHIANEIYNEISKGVYI